MTRLLITTTILLVYTLRSPADDALRIPTHGNWQGQAIGSWKSTRITYDSPKKPVKQGKIYKALLLGENEDKNTIVVWGETDEGGNYLKKDPTTVSGAWSEDNPIPVPDEVRDEVLTIDNREYPVVVKILKPKPDKRSGIMMGSEVWELKSRPGFVLIRNQSQRDSFKGETFEYLISEKVVGVGRTNVHGKVVHFFRVQHDEVVDGRTTSRAVLLKSNELPGQGLIHSLQTWYNEDGSEKSTTEIELVGFGHSPDEASAHRTKRSRRFPRKYATIDSEAGKVNITHLMRQGMPRELAEQIVTTRVGVEDLEYGRKRAAEIAVQWKAYQAAQSGENRRILLTKLEQIGSNSIGYIEPSLEEVLLEISRDDDAELRIAALTTLSGYVSVLYAPMLEDALIKEKQCTNPLAIRILSSTKWGNPRRVLSQKGVDISSLPLRSIPYAPESLAIKELMRRYEAGDKFRKSKILEHLSYYSTPKVRALFTDLANSLSPDDFIWGKSDRSYLARHVIAAAADLNVEGAPNLFLKWMTWNGSVGTEDSAKPQDLMMKSAIDTTLMISGVRLRDPRVSAKISERISQGSIPLPLFMSDEGLEKLGDIELDITPEKVEALLSKSMPMLMSEKPLKDEQLYGLLRLFRFSPDDEDLTYIMSKLAPNWSAKTDYAAMAQAQNKYWYTQRKGIKPLNVREMHPEIMTDILPYFGDEGAKLLIQLCGHPGFRRHVVPALMKVSHRRDEARKVLAGMHARSDDDRFLIDLTLWCLGDTSRSAECEKYIRFEPLHSSRAHKARSAMCYLPFETVYLPLQDIHNNNPDNKFGMWASAALSHYRNRRSAEFIMSLWEQETTSRYNPEYGELFNRMAGQNFGMDRNKIRKWIQDMP